MYTIENTAQNMFTTKYNNNKIIFLQTNNQVRSNLYLLGGLFQLKGDWCPQNKQSYLFWKKRTFHLDLNHIRNSLRVEISSVCDWNLLRSYHAAQDVFFFAQKFILHNKTQFQRYKMFHHCIRKHILKLFKHY